MQRRSRDGTQTPSNRLRACGSDAGRDRPRLLVVDSGHRAARRADLAGNVHPGARRRSAPDGRDRPRRADHRHPGQPGWGVDLCAAAVVLAKACCSSGATQRADLMKRIAVWAFYGVGALAILYLALYAYAAFTGRDLVRGDPIHIFRKPDAPNYSAATGGDFA